MVTFTSTTLLSLFNLDSRPLLLTRASHKRGGTTPCCPLPKIHITTKSFTYDLTSIPDLPNCMMMTPLRIFWGAAVDGSTNLTATGDKLWIRIRFTITVEHFAPKAHNLELDPGDAFSRCNDATTVTPHYRTQTLIIRYKCHRIGWYRHTGSVPMLINLGQMHSVY
jgi:hypothetical protein